MIYACKQIWQTARCFYRSTLRIRSEIPDETENCIFENKKLKLDEKVNESLPYDMRVLSSVECVQGGRKECE
jgi:hypothetical protein